MKDAIIEFFKPYGPIAVFIVSMFPIVELRGAIPFVGAPLGIPFWLNYCWRSQEIYSLFRLFFCFCEKCLTGFASITGLVNGSSVSKTALSAKPKK